MRFAGLFSMWNKLFNIISRLNIHKACASIDISKKKKKKNYEELSRACTYSKNIIEEGER